MKFTHRIFVSAENNAYCGWQTKLFYFSCVTRLNHHPTIVVHDSGQPWHQDFSDLARAGARVCSAPSYSQSVHDDYPPRNTAGTLLHAAGLCGDAEFIVLCDPDMIFVSEPEFPSSLSGNYYFYMDYDRKEVVAAARRLHVAKDRMELQKEELRCGVPYVIPVAEARRLGESWLQAVDAFAPRNWIDIMHAFGLAVMNLGLRLTLTDFVDTNLRPGARSRREIIHYCYGDEKWEKRDFVEHRAGDVWNPIVKGRKGTILGEIVSQITEAEKFYRSTCFEPRLVVANPKSRR
jgi:hypothetical protein